MARGKRNDGQETLRDSPFMKRGDTPVVPGQASTGVTASTGSTAPMGSTDGRRQEPVSLPSFSSDAPFVPGMDASGAQSNEVALFAAQREAHRGMDPRKRGLVISIVSVIVLIPLFTILPTGIFSDSVDRVSVAYIVDAVAKNVEGIVNWLTGGPVTTGVSIVIWQTLAVAVVGAALSLNGCVYQSALRNPLASPSTLGVMSGGTLGTLVFVLAFAVPQSAGEVVAISASDMQRQFESLDVGSYILVTQGRALCSLAGCMAVVLLVLLVAHIAGRGKVSKVGLLIAGQVFAALITGVITVVRAYLMHFGTFEQQEALSYVVGGDVTRIANPFDFALLAVPVLVGVVIIWLLRFKLNALAFGDEEASTMGVHANSMRTIAIVICTLLTGVVVSYVGAVGFVGFLVPHMARKLVGPDLTYLIPTSMFFGASFLLTANYVMRLTGLFSGSLGTLTSLVGAIAFLVIAVRQRARGNVDWI